MIDRAKHQIGHLLNPESATQHQHEHRQITLCTDNIEECSNFAVLQEPWQRFGQTQGQATDHRVGYLQLFILLEITVEAADGDQMAVDCLWAESSIQKHIDEVLDMDRLGRLNRDRQPDKEVLQPIQVISSCVI